MGVMEVPLTVDFQQTDGELFVRLKGDVTYNSDLSKLVGVEASRVVLDIGGLERLNSRGVIIWMESIDLLCKRSPKVEIHNAPHTFMQHYGLIRNFISSARIESVRAAFLCDQCGTPKVAVLERSRDFPAGRIQTASPPSCERCKKPMSPDDAVFHMDLGR